MTQHLIKLNDFAIKSLAIKFPSTVKSAAWILDNRRTHFTAAQ